MRWFGDRASLAVSSNGCDDGRIPSSGRRVVGIKTLLVVASACCLFVNAWLHPAEKSSHPASESLSFAVPTRLPRNASRPEQAAVSSPIPAARNATREASPSRAKTKSVKAVSRIHRIAKRRQRIYDTTLPWNETMHRPWLQALDQYQFSPTNRTHPLHSKPPQAPSVMLLLTNQGWNQPNQTEGRTYVRSLRERELYTAIVNHPWFHPTGFADISAGRLPIFQDTHYYVFADRLGFNELNYPQVGGSWETNLDTHGNRTRIGKKGMVRCHTGALKLFTHPLFAKPSNGASSATTSATAVLFSGTSTCRVRRRGGSKGVPTSIVFTNGLFSYLDEAMDQNLIPSGNHLVRLSNQEEEDIRTCAAELSANRPHNVVYLGNFRSGWTPEFKQANNGGARKAYAKFHNPAKHILIRKGGERNPATTTETNETVVYNYTDTLRQAKFGLAPRGDQKFSHRFTEVLSAGAIPVFHGDDYALPFRPEVVDWSKCAIVLPEKDAGHTTLRYLEHELLPDPQTLCALRNYCYFDIYKKHIDREAHPTAPIDGILAGLEAVARKGGDYEPLAGIRCTNESIASLECNPL